MERRLDSKPCTRRAPGLGQGDAVGGVVGEVPEGGRGSLLAARGLGWGLGWGGGTGEGGGWSGVVVGAERDWGGCGGIGGVFVGGPVQGDTRSFGENSKNKHINPG